MAEKQNFRSALGGFNRKDVVHYIEYINANHASQVNQLKTELQNLQQKLQALKANSGEDLSEQITQLEAKCSQAEQEREEYRLQAERAQEELAKLQAFQEERLAQQELEAYRRAERAERLANERAQLIYDRANGVLADATVKVDETAAQIGGLSDRVCAQLASLQAAVSGSKQALHDAASSLYGIRPETEK